MRTLIVTKILEGGVDLCTGQELGRCIVISNGVREQEVPIDQQALQSLIVMCSEHLESDQAPDVGPGMFEYDEADMHEEDVGTPSGSLRVVRSEEAPPSTDLVEEKFEAGEEYDDSGTGVSSL